MTIEMAHKILDGLKDGQSYSLFVINAALRMVGDLNDLHD